MNKFYRSVAWVLLLWAEVASAQVGNFPALIGQRGSTQPTTCSVAQLFFDTSKTAGSNLYGCTSANTWTALGGSGTVAFPVTVTGGTSGGIPYFSSTTAMAASSLLAQYGVVVGGGAGNAPATSSGLTFGGAAAGTGLAIAAGTATTAVNAQSITQTWNASGVTFTGKLTNITNTASAAASLVEDWQVGGASMLRLGVGTASVGGTAGPQLYVGNGSTTSQGWILGYGGFSGRSFLQTTGAATDGNSFTILTVASDTYWNTPSGGKHVFTVGNTGSTVQMTATALRLNTNPVIGFTAPTLASGGCTSPTAVTSNGTAGFSVGVGTSCSGSQPLVFTLPAATTGWNCYARNVTNGATSAPAQTGAVSTTSVTITNFVRTTGVAGAWTDSDVVAVSCLGY